MTDGEGVALNERNVIKNLEEGELYKFLGVLEGLKQEEQQFLQCAAKSYLRCMSLIWTSPHCDWMWTLHWSITELRTIDREVRKLIVVQGGKPPCGLTSLFYLPREKGERGLRAVEDEYKVIKVKSALKFYTNRDSTMQMVRDFEEYTERRGHQLLVRDGKRFAEVLHSGFTLKLNYPEPKCINNQGEVFSDRQIKKQLKSALEIQHWGVIKSENWQGRLLKIRAEDDELDKKGCYVWLSKWTECPTHTVAGMYELYEQMLPTKLYTSKKTKTTLSDDLLCRLCGRCPESVAHVLAGCSALAQSKYLERHNAALKVLYFELLRDLKLINEVPPWYSPVQP